MKKVFLMLAALMLMATCAWAVPMQFNEQFLGSKTDANFFDLNNGWSANFGFDLTGQGAQAVLRNEHGSVNDTRNPTLDATGFIPAQLKVTEADLSFAISSADWLIPETAVIRAGLFDGDIKIFEKTFSLGALTWRGIQRQYADIDIDLFSVGLGEYLADGKFLAVALAPERWYCNDFRIESANLNVSAAAVPEPGTIVLLGTGLLGLGLFSRRRMKMKNSLA